MFHLYRELLLCSLIINHLISVESYGPRPQSAEKSELSDVGVPNYLPEFLKSERIANARVRRPGVKTFTKTSHRGDSALGEYVMSAERGTYKGGCKSQPESPVNSALRCSIVTGCQATCMSGYQFPNGQTSIILVCSDGEWEVQGSEWPVVPPCEPICLPACQNNGICVSPGECNCAENFSGPQCQYEKKPCLNLPALPRNSRRECTSAHCTISCMKGHTFPDGSAITNLACKEGQWIPTRKDMVTVPDCRPVCHPPCLNGGNCLALNVCQCPQEYRGAQCQYSALACSQTKLGFNGGYNCSGDGESFSCSLACPAGIKFSSPPVPVYVCNYASGVFTPQPIPQCVYGKGKVIFSEAKRVKAGTQGKYNKTITSDMITKKQTGMTMMENRRPHPGTCHTWGGAHFKTFDGKVYSFQSPCQHVLVRDAQDNTFSVMVQVVKGYRRVVLFLQDKEYTLEAADDGGIIFKSTKRLLPIPAQLPGLRVEMVGHMVQLSLESLGLKVKWDVKQLVQVDVTESLWNRTEGLCGRLDGNPENDMAMKQGIVPKSLATLADSWQIKKIGDELCEDRPSEQHACSQQSKEFTAKAEAFCTSLITKTRFASCSAVMDISLLLETCKWDYCGCPAHQSHEECGCDSLAVYAGQCVSQGIKSLSKWRDQNTCMMNCTGGRVYQACGPAVQPSCGGAADMLAPAPETCSEGCFCPRGMLLHAGRCLTKDQCPCRLRGKQFPSGASVPKDCNTCTCQNGEWVCTQVFCGARCSAVGDPHYTTFDGKRYNFMGQCSYYLVKGSNFSIEAENVACSGAISENMNLATIDNIFEKPSCTRMVTIRYGPATVQLKQGRNIVVNGKDVTKLPMKAHGLKIRAASSIFIKVAMPNGLQIWWDGITSAHVDAPASFHGHSKGLCGTFNNNQKDDFLTPEADIEQAVIPFANKWKTQEKCADIPDKELPHPCNLNPQNKATAEKLCSKLKNKLFEECHWSVDVTPFYDDCMYDVCSCDGTPVDRCLCPILGAYATECARQGIQIQWRYNVKECEVHCPGGQTYQVCGDSCARSCEDLSGSYEDSLDASEEARCRPQCVEGCNCPTGQALDSHGECVPTGSCPCRHAGLVFPPQYKEVRPGAREQELCLCNGGQWDCHPATPEEIKAFPRAADIKDKCSASKHEEFTTCEPVEPLTCRNMHQPPEDSSPAECHPGCQCMKGYVLDSVAKKCIKAVDCPCHHGGHSYPDGHTMQEDCNTCKCNGGKWSCEKRPCAGVCSTWGDSHFKTFDSKQFGFHGVCTYLLSKGSLDSIRDSFSVEIQSEVCGTSGVTCSKSVTLKVGMSVLAESVTFTKDKPLPKTDALQRIRIRKAGLFIFAEVPSLGIVVQWDRGTRVYVRADPKWKGRLKGLCGNYNNNEADDFQTPSGGLSEASPLLFADSWKMQPHCPSSHDIQDTCKLHPERTVWSTQACGALKRAPFASCHTEVPPGDYVRRCEMDSCACGTGGDCACLCTALAAYAHECASRGVPIKWRTQDLCPMQCDNTCENYSPCISACPVETCENTLIYTQVTEMCHHDTCIEGCVRKKPCPPEHVVGNFSTAECVPRPECKPVCLTLPNGKVILEGEIMKQDQCHTCHCSRGKKICKGQACATLPPAIPTGTKAVTHMMEQKSACKNGWSGWISNKIPEHVKEEVNQKTKAPKSSKPYSVEAEPLPSLMQLNNLGGSYCTSDMMVEIECRTIGEELSAKETGLQAECSLEKGLFCRQPKDQPCPDFEIRVKCDCGKEELYTTPITPSMFETTEMDEDLLPQVAWRRKTTTKSPDRTYKTITENKEKLLVMPEESEEDLLPQVARRRKTTTKSPDRKHTTVSEGKEEIEVGSEEDLLPQVARRKSTILPPKRGKLQPRIMHTTTLKCDLARPNQEHPLDCAMFYQCAPGMGPVEHPDLVAKTCGPNMFYNPKSMNCDWPQAVIAMKPKCGEPSIHPTIGSLIDFKNETEKDQCEEGMVWSDCAVDCKKVCLFYKYYLQKDRKCKNGHECIPGCIDETIAKKPCGKGYLWRDAQTCVSIADCTCHSKTGRPVKPGEALKESECETCQCLKNQYTCGISDSCETSTTERSLKVSPVKYMSGGYGIHFPFTTTGKPELTTKIHYLQAIPVKGDIRKSSITPPPECHPDKYTNVLWDDIPQSDEAFSASSSLGSSFEPQHAVLNGTVTDHSGGSWSPEQSTPDEYIQVKLDHAEPIYGIIMQGSPLFDQYVTSYKVMHSKNGKHFTYVTGPDGAEETFRGPTDNLTPLKQMFANPFESRYIRVRPLTWHDTIAVRMELIGCSEISRTLTPVSSKPTPGFTTITGPSKLTECEKPKELLGLPIKKMRVSSFKPEFPSKFVQMDQPAAWQPLTNSPGEWVQFEFPENENITGIISKGGPEGWVSAYNLKYSPDGNNWNPAVDDNKEVQSFPANFDEDTPVTNSFEKPIRARFLRIVPTKWKKNIQMKIEPQGCTLKSEKYELEELLDFTEEPPAEALPDMCRLCKGIPVSDGSCSCEYPLMYDGNDCVESIQCPCIVGHIPYTVGATYQKENCEICTCKLGGVPDCNKKTCPKCKAGTVREMTVGCECRCEPCPTGERACPTSEVCVKEEAWCDGMQDCPDDEVDCETSTVAPNVTATKEEKCPEPTCPRGYKVSEKKQSSRNLELLRDGQVAPDSLFAQPSKSARKGYMRYYKGAKGGGGGGGTKGGVKTSEKLVTPLKTLESPIKAEKVTKKECPQWRCLSARPPPPLAKPGQPRPTPPPCPAPRCPPEYTMSLDNEQVDENDCPKYICSPPPRRDAVCNVTCRTFNTFDGTEYQYDICNHVLARDAEANTWDVTVQNNCTKGEDCVHELLISQGADQVRFRPDLTVEYNGYIYTVDQTRKIGFQTQSFAISRLGETLFYISTKYGFWVIYDAKRNAKIGIAGKLIGRVDGLCGFFNGIQADDRRKPDGSQALTTEEFGDSWAHKDNPIVCEAKSCPIHLQNMAWEICKTITHKQFSGCKSAMNLEKSRTRCLERVCDCLQSTSQKNAAKDSKNPAEKWDLAKYSRKCNCEALQSFVTECQATNSAIDLQGWRTVMDCPVVCAAPLVHYDCFRRSCELSCNSLQEEKSPCPVTPGVCFSGCFCPEGLVRKGENCILPTECRDCVCDGLGKPEYITYDKRNFTFNGNCTYIASQEKLMDNKRAFQVFVTNGECPHNPDAICTVAVHITHDDHVIHVQKEKNQLTTIVDGIKVLHFPLVNKWLNLQEVSGKDISLLIPAIQLEVSSIFHNMAFSVRVPSKLYGMNMEGLCGDCDADQGNDLGQSDDPREYGLSWRAPAPDLKALDIREETCEEKPKSECWPLPPEKDPCFKIMDEPKFGKCHAVVDPVPYLASCQQDLCAQTKQLGVCVSLEAYALECRRAGICLDWRRKELCPYNCEVGLSYKPCGLGCQVTCENYEKYSKKPSLCPEPPSEGCFCPEGKVLVNNTCISPSKCFPCDSQGHFVGDSWQKDECTMCSCPKRGGVACVTSSCVSATACPFGHTAQQVAKQQGQCCPEFVCIVKPTESMPQCEDPVKITCSYGQEMKLETMADNCPKFICQCKPIEECETLNLNDGLEMLELGMTKVINDTGCCPQTQLICKPESCPTAPRCPPHHTPTKSKKQDKCCSTYTCEPPSDKCLYDMEFESSPKGGEFRRKPESVETMPKNVGSTWQDGPCRTCMCKKIGGAPAAKTKTSSQVKPILQAVCSVTQCPAMPASEDFIADPVGVPFSCCAEPKFTACKYQGNIYKIGEEWQSDSDPCVSYLCAAKDDDTLEKRTNVKQCDKKCQKGSKYIPSTNPRKICCGECMPEACVVNGVERKIGEKWTSKDLCTNYSCLNKNGSLQVQSDGVTCPAISDATRKEFELEEVPVEGKCCKKIRPIACKVNGKVYKVGDQWKSESDPCKSYLCATKSDNTLEKRTNIKQCEIKCKQGFEYHPSADPAVCCGECVPVACVVAGVERRIGEEWTSKDHCTNYFCLNKSGTLQIQAVNINCPPITKEMKEDYEIQEIPVEGKCCKTIKPIACKVNGTIYKVGEELKSPSNPCISHVCTSKKDGTLEKRTNIKECDKKCKQGWEYKPALSSEKICCGECIPVACVIDGVERKIGEKWTSQDLCTSYTCLSKNGTLQVATVSVTCPPVAKNLKQEFEVKEIKQEGECCKKVEIVACKVNGEIYKEGSTWNSPDGDPCKNVTCTRDLAGKIVKTESTEACHTECSLGWEYVPSDDSQICCGQCKQVACVINNKVYKPGKVWFSPDNCTQFSCDKQADAVQVGMSQESCPDVSDCEPSHLYTKGCCKHCNMTSLAQSSCVSESMPIKDTIGLVHQTKPPHGMCVNKKPLYGFKECKGTCVSGTIYNEESLSQDTDCKCCQTVKFGGLIVDLTCEDGHVYKKQVAIPLECACSACVGESSKMTKSGRKIPGLKTAMRSSFSSEGNNEMEDVEMLPGFK